jgi:hypothetical protein
MEMKKNDADRMAGILAGLKLTGIKDKVVRTTLLNDYLALRRIAKELKEEQQELVDKFNQEWGGADKEKNDEYRKALDDVTAMLKSLAEEETDVTLKPVDMDAFMVNVKEELTFEQIAILQDGGLLG